MTSLNNNSETPFAEQITGALFVALFGAVAVLNTASVVFTLVWS